MKNNNFTEEYILDKFLRKLSFNKIEALNFKNDGAFFKIPKKTKLVVTNDSILESVDFFDIDPPESVANKIITCNLSDLSAMGAKPYCYTLSLCLPKNISYKWLFKFSRTLFLLQKKFNFFLIGGDLSKSNKIIVSANFFGFISKGKILNRTNTKLNDSIWVTGNLGESSIGLKIKRKKIKMSVEDKKYFLNKYLYPKHFSGGHLINNIATSSIDISDGFYGDLEKLLEINRIGASIESKLIPMSSKVKKLIKKKLISIDYLLKSGDDYQLIFTTNPKKDFLLKKLSKKYNIKITKVGKIIDKNGIYLDDKKIKFTNKSFQHFS